jgi:hypothetical protein
MASGYGTPPVMTRELADAAGGYIRTLVHNVSVRQNPAEACS